ncbi:MAG: hypothetical protein JSV04_02855 [Candidatus Heimdallarchaeota archaeon]|nr:MAG: hypothetical protein JSV04_02855 [Candidatus Heimdallarchaeota archaeon]
MNCKLIHIIFNRNESNFFSKEKDALVESILSLGKIQRISIDFTNELCNHANQPSQVFWREVPIVRIKCMGVQCEFDVVNNQQDVLFHLIRPVTRLTRVRYIAVLGDFRLPGWSRMEELIVVLNRAGKLLIVSSQNPLSTVYLSKLKRRIKAHANKLLRIKDEVQLLDIIAPDIIPNNEFRVSFRDK